MCSTLRLGAACLSGVLALAATAGCGQGQVLCGACDELLSGVPSEEELPTLPSNLTPSGERLSVDVAADVHPISPFIYGTNEPRAGDVGLALVRAGGNRWSTYNWENNASNAGSDYHHQNDSHLGGGDAPGEAVRSRVAAAHAIGAAALVTVPIIGRVAADKRADGDVQASASYLESRFVESRARKGSAFSPPDPSDGVVYQDEYVAWLEGSFPGARDAAATTVFYSLDNEPDLWSSTHPRVHPAATTYVELIDKSIEYASAIKDVVPQALIFGPVSYGWSGFVSLQAAPDAAGRDFLAHFLARMKSAGAASGRRLVDVLDVHWYPEATGDGVRVIEPVSTPGCVEARLQAPRSLWDPAYVEDSWITGYLGEPIALLPRLREKIAATDPSVRIGITEYYFGGGGHISGGLAQVDALGVFAREDVFAAALWGYERERPFIDGAFALYRDYDGEGARFGDTSVRATASDVEAISVFASVDSARPGSVWVIAVNKTSAALSPTLALAGADPVSEARVYRLDQESPRPVAVGRMDVTGAEAVVELPPFSATLLVLSP